MNRNGVADITSRASGSGATVTAPAASRPALLAAPAAQAILERVLEGSLPAGCRPLELQHAGGPALSGSILILAPEDITGPHRPTLLALAREAPPGRPVLVGGTRHRDLLLEAINQWRVFRIVPEGTRPAVLLDALTKAQEAVEIQRGLEQTAAALAQENASLEKALADLEATQEQLRHSERLATLGRITSSLIPVIASHLEALQEFNAAVGAGPQRRDPRLEELLGYAFTGIRSLHAMLDEIRGYAESRPEAYRFEPEEVDAVVKFAVAFSRFDPLAGQRTIETVLSSNARIRGDCFRLYQTLINLVRNAFQATPPRGRIEVRTFVDGDHVVVDVENTGPPITPEVRARLFEPFFTTKGDQGMGLGLSMCRTTIERHGGSITCESGPDDRTRFRIRLPKLA